jgi:hypothetical protein
MVVIGWVEELRIGFHILPVRYLLGITVSHEYCGNSNKFCGLEIIFSWVSFLTLIVDLGSRSGSGFGSSMLSKGF